MKDVKPDVLLRQALSQGLDVQGVVPHIFADRGLGLVASTDLDVDSLLISVPTRALKTVQTVPQWLRQLTDGISAQGLLAIDLILDKSKTRRMWKEVLPETSSFEDAFPFWWDQSLQKLLPETTLKLVTKQNNRLDSDWSIISDTFPSLTMETYSYYWFTVGTRVFYYRESELDRNEDPDECLALVPFADLFNHSSKGCKVTFSRDAYTFSTKQKIAAGEEVFANYGEHGNDFLLAEYGFVLEHNEHDSVALDFVLTDLFDDKQREILESYSFWGSYALDTRHICYRTEVALRLLCMPFDLWHRSLTEGFDEADEYRETVDAILRKSLEKYALVAQQTLTEIAELDPQYRAQRSLLKQRWDQISQTLDNGLLTISRNAEVDK